MTQVCPVCSSTMHNAFTATLLKKYQVQYFQCASCGLLQTEAPYWLDEAYGDAVGAADTGLVVRNHAIATKLSTLLYWFFDPKGTFVDVAGGYGMLVRLMRDKGFHFLWQDKYCQNVLARGFEMPEEHAVINAMTAIEVFEHVHDPLAFVREKIEQYRCKTLIFTTDLYSGEGYPALDWYYYSLNTGQHISFYTRETLEHIAKQLGLNFYSVRQLHILTDRTLHPIGLSAWQAARWVNPLLSKWVTQRLGSLTMHDHWDLMAKTGGKA